MGRALGEFVFVERLGTLFRVCGRKVLGLVKRLGQDVFAQNRASFPDEDHVVALLCVSGRRVIIDERRKKHIHPDDVS